MTHTATPWKFDSTNGCKAIKGGKSGNTKQAQYKEIAYTVGLSNEEEDKANAQFIATACNSHDALLAAAKAALDGFEAVYNSLDSFDDAKVEPIKAILRSAIAQAEPRQAEGREG